MTLKVGDKAPPLAGTDQGRAEVNLELSGKLVVFFYPEDGTPGCTTEACQFRDDLADFLEMGARVVGVSTDDVGSHRRFAQKNRLQFTLLADSDKRIAQAFDVLDSGGRAQRVTYVIEDGIISHVFPKVNPNGHSRQVWMTLFGGVNGPQSRGPAPEDKGVSEDDATGYDAEKAWDAIALGLGQRLRDIVLAIDRVDALRPGPEAEGWLRPFLADKEQVADAAEDLILRTFRAAADPINFKLLLRLVEERTVSMKDLMASVGLTRVRAAERVNDLIQVGLCTRELEGDIVLATGLTDALVGLLAHIRERLTAKVRESFAKRWERRPGPLPSQPRTL